MPCRCLLHCFKCMPASRFCCMDTVSLTGHQAGAQQSFQLQAVELQLALQLMMYHYISASSSCWQQLWTRAGALQWGSAFCCISMLSTMTRAQGKLAHQSLLYRWFPAHTAHCMPHDQPYCLLGFICMPEHYPARRMCLARTALV